eukprot:scaffold152_cov163-Amphora_coffeaeformis.AAC.13
MSSAKEEEELTICQTGQCLCGKVKFQVKGTVLFNELCHCRACGRARGMTPVHIIGIQGEFTVLPQGGGGGDGSGAVKTVPGIGTMEHAICAACGGGLYQRPLAMTSLYAVFPTTFQLETAVPGSDVPSCLLPPHLRPQSHVNYENRHFNHYDTLPKYKTFAGSSPRMNNEGEIIQD